MTPPPAARRATGGPTEAEAAARADDDGSRGGCIYSYAYAFEQSPTKGEPAACAPSALVWIKDSSPPFQKASGYNTNATAVDRAADVELTLWRVRAAAGCTRTIVT